MDIALFGVAAGIVFAAGPRLARTAQLLAHRYRIGEVLAGAILLGVVTSLPGLVLTVTAAARGDTELAVSNSLGGVAAQTMFIAIADVVYRRRPLSSAVPTRDVAFQCALLVALLALVIIGVESPGLSLWRIHPVTIVIVAVYVVGVRVGSTLGAGDSPAEIEGGLSGTRGKIGDEPAQADQPEDAGVSNRTAWTRFGLLAGALVAAGASLSWSAPQVGERLGLSATVVGVAFTAVATSTPELVTAVAAARSGAIGLAAGDIVGGNVFDTLFVAAADLASDTVVFTASGPSTIMLAATAVVMNATLLAGVLRKGAGAYEVDLENVAIVGVWVAMVVLLVV